MIHDARIPTYHGIAYCAHVFVGVVSLGCLALAGWLMLGKR